MTRQDFIIKWGAYALALLPTWFLELFVLSRFPVAYGVIPMLIPLAAVSLAVLEGPLAGGSYGLFAGAVCDAVYFSSTGSMTVLLCLMGLVCGVLARYVLRQNVVGCLVCSALTLAVIDLVRVVTRLVGGRAPLPALLRVAGTEILWSMVFALPVFALYYWVFCRVPQKTVL